MAVVHELAVDFGTNAGAARAPALDGCGVGMLRAGPHAIPLHRPRLHEDGPNTYLTVSPVAVGYGLVCDGPWNGPRSPQRRCPSWATGCTTCSDGSTAMWPRRWAGGCCG